MTTTNVNNFGQNWLKVLEAGPNPVNPKQLAPAHKLPDCEHFDVATLSAVGKTRANIPSASNPLKIATAPKPKTSSTGFIWPTNAGYMTSGFGWRTGGFHPGIDLGVAHWTPIKASRSGTVTSAGWIGGYGKAVVINHGNGFETLYAHNNEIKVRVGQKVSAGQLISYSGSTGFSTGPHLHFEIYKNGTPVNPMYYLPKQR